MTAGDRFQRSVAATAVSAFLVSMGAGGLGPTASMLAWFRCAAGAFAVSALIGRVRRELPGTSSRRGWLYLLGAFGAASAHDLPAFVGAGGPGLNLLVSVLVLGGGVRAGQLLPRTSPSPHQAIREVVETVLVCGSALIVVWVTYLGDRFESSPLPVVERLSTLAFPASLLMVASGSALLASRAGARSRIALTLGSLAGAVAAAGELGRSVDVLRSGLTALDSTWGPPWVFMGSLIYVLGGLGAERSSAESDEGPGASFARPASTRRLGWLFWLVPPSAALALAFPRLRPGSADPALLAMSTAVVVVLLAHQLFMLLENDRLLRQLDNRVAERTAELADRNRYYQGLFEHSADVILVVAADGRFSDCTPSLRPVLGWDADRVVGRDAEELLRDVGSAETASALRRVRSSDSATEVLVDRIPHHDGRLRSVEISLANHLGDPAIRGIVATIRDVTVRLELETELAHQAFHDQLTGLPNRTLFRNAVERALGNQRQGSVVTVMFLDLNGFKAINDTFGHPAGDALLQAFSSRIRKVLGAGDTFARLGGDEFAILVGPGGDPHEIARGVYRQLEFPFSIAGTEVDVATSIGIADSSAAGYVDDLLRNADVAMYRCKHAGVRMAVEFQAEMHEEAAQRLQMQADLRRAIEAGTLDVWMQPVIHMASGEVEGFEALVRWDHPTHGSVPPSEFVPLAEECGLIEPLGELVLRRAAYVVARENRQQGTNHSIAVNISARQLENDQFASIVEQVLVETGLPSRSLILEITESMVMRDPDAARIRLQRLAAVGVRIALDDFGTGYSSLAALSRFSLDILKVDRAFVAALSEENSSAGPLLAAIEELGRALGLTLVAEGVETPDECDRLLALGFSLAQGYLFGEPLPAVDALAGLRRRRAAR